MKLKHVVISIALAAICCAPLRLAQGQIPVAVAAPRSVFYVDIKGAKQGQFKAESLPSAVHKGTIEGVKFSSTINSPRDVVTGLPSGKRQYSPITFTKLWGPSSPEMIQACATNEFLTITFEFVKVDRTGKEIVYQTIKLTNATISSVKRYIDVSMGSEAPDPRELEDVSFTFQKIDIYDANGAAVSDDWLAPR